MHVESCQIRQQAQQTEAKSSSQYVLSDPSKLYFAVMVSWLIFLTGGTALPSDLSDIFSALMVNQATHLTEGERSSQCILS